MEKDHLEILLEDINGKFDLVIEGHGALRQRMDRLAEESRERDEHLLFLIQSVNSTLGGKIDAVAADLAAHRRDTEAHGGVYRVKEPEGA